MTQQIIVVGAGVAGLTAATLLAAEGHQVQVMDRRPKVLEASPSSFNLTLNTASRRLLKGIDISFDDVGQIVHGRHIMDRNRHSHTFAYGARQTDVLCSIPRQSLIERLYAAATAAGVTVQTGTRLVELDPSVGTACIERPTGAKVDIGPALWVAGDGIFSICRYHVARAQGASNARVDSGTSYVSLTIPAAVARNASLDGRWIHFAPSKGATTIGLPNVDGSLSLVVEWTRDAGVAGTTVASDLVARAILERFDNRHLLELVPDLASTMVGCRVGKFSYVTSDSWASDHVVLLGDAAHALPPYLGTGANSAILDAFAFVDSIRKEPTFSHAAARYAKDRKAFFALLDQLAHAHEQALHRGNWGAPAWRAAQRLDALNERLFGTRTTYQQLVFDLPLASVDRFLQASVMAQAG